MKINTDGVLLGALADAVNPTSVLDIGTGTGVIALMLAQKFAKATVDAVEIDKSAAQTAANNFESSPFFERMTLHSESFEKYFDNNPQIKHDLIVSNPPFFLNSLKSPFEEKSLAKHTDIEFFEKLTAMAASHLSKNGSFWLILPLISSEMVISLAKVYGLFGHQVINIRSYVESAPHRCIISFKSFDVPAGRSDFVIYASSKLYSEAYKTLLHPYFLAV